MKKYLVLGLSLLFLGVGLNTAEAETDTWGSQTIPQVLLPQPSTQSLSNPEGYTVTPTAYYKRYKVIRYYKHGRWYYRYVPYYYYAPSYRSYGPGVTIYFGTGGYRYHR